MRLIRTIKELTAPDWDACANPPHAPFDPFLSHAFLRALEDSGSATAESGWGPLHLILDGTEQPAGAVPLYLKGHSYGEFVFDHGWADAYERAGGRYYPKLLSAVPFTPVTGRRLLIRDPETREDVGARLVKGLKASAQKLQVSSVHVNFATDEQWQALGHQDFLQRTDQQFHWHNKGYKDFDDFLGDLASRKRKSVRKERATALENGISVEWLTGSDIREDHWDAFFTFYMDTGARKWGSPYLTRPFFSMIGETLADHILLILAKRAGRYIAGALNMIGSEALYGRYWGTTEHHPCLHFEICYYQAIDFAIEKGLIRVEAGAQGAHKIARGYEPVETRSAHWVADPGFARALSDFLTHERAAVSEDMEALKDRTPFRKGPSAQ